MRSLEGKGAKCPCKFRAIPNVVLKIGRRNDVIATGEHKIDPATELSATGPGRNANWSRKVRKNSKLGVELMIFCFYEEMY